MRKVFILDFEATGVDPMDARTLEVAIYSYGIETKQAHPIYCSVVYSSEYPVVSKEVLDLTGISNEELEKGVHPKEVFEKLCSLFQPMPGDRGTVIVAHNGNTYDRILFEQECRRYGITPPELVWVDTMRDLPYDAHCRKLSHMTLDHGFIVDPSTLHRASADVELVAKILSKYDFKELFKRATAKKVIVKAVVSYDEREKAKAKGFHWGQIQGEAKKGWIKEVIESELSKEKLGWDFPISLVC